MDALSQIKEIMDNFDFTVVRLVMELPVHRTVDETVRKPWKMLLASGRFDIPTEEELKNHALKLLIDIANKPDDDYYDIQCGPFKAYKWYGKMGLTFACEDWEIDADD